ncbi:hypothetical protein QBC42DRAFT_324040 [Cladorrhinum samala]|uniref:Uncharacterized protein n=1 Tax=Cladorrhinum samala TaxID=585594 RepID=A0AAV9HRZ0_9PEZI|nr:hypothetical protein QBC42DRAFT_324040 [Cladorrhinum samala]
MLARTLISLAVLASSGLCQTPVVKAIDGLNAISARLDGLRSVANTIQPISCVNYLADDESKRSGPWQDIEYGAGNLTNLLFSQAVRIERLPTITAFYTVDGARMFDASSSLAFVLERFYNVIASKAEGDDKARCLWLPIFGRRVSHMLGGLHTGIETYENAIDLFNPEYKNRTAPIKANTRGVVERTIGRYLIRV